jgi:uroporphyrinogen-III decarboxylase
MNGRERIRRTLRREPTDRPPIDLGSTAVTGIQATTYARLRQALGLPDAPVKVEEPFQLLAEVEEPLRRALGIDTIGLWARDTIFGFPNQGWKPWTLPDGTPALVSERFRTTIDEKGDTLIYPKGDVSARPSGRLPKGGYYFDAIIRQPPFDEDHLDPQDWAEQFSVFTDEELRDLETRSKLLYEETEYGVVGCFGQAGVGDIAFVPGQMLREPKGLRDPNLWYEYLATHPDYIKGLFDLWAGTAMKNLELYRQAVGDRIDVIFMGGTDFGGQQGPLISPKMFRELFKPYYKVANDWVHRNTGWKTFYHSCGSIAKLLDDFVDMGVDILNPVQCSAAGMEPAGLKARYGDKLVFWGGGVDTQQTMPFGTAAEVRAQAAERLRILGAGGGYVHCSIHNIQARTPVENVLAFFEVAKGEPVVA